MRLYYHYKQLLPSGAIGIYVVKDKLTLVLLEWFYMDRWGISRHRGRLCNSKKKYYGTQLPENLFNKDTVLKNGKITYNGEVENDASFCAFWILSEIESETSYIVSYASAHFVNFFDEDKNIPIPYSCYRI